MGRTDLLTVQRFRFSDFEVLIISVSSTVIASHRLGARRRRLSEAIQSHVRRAIDCFVCGGHLAMTVEDGAF
jgi:hypothetical protein